MKMTGQGLSLEKHRGQGLFYEKTDWEEIFFVKKMTGPRLFQECKMGATTFLKGENDRGKGFLLEL